jgi:hypothetical protein
LIIIHREMCLALILSDPGELLDEIASRALAVLEECDQVIREAAGIEPVLSPSVEVPKAEPANAQTAETPEVSVEAANPITDEAPGRKVQLLTAEAEVEVPKNEPEPAVAVESIDEAAWKEFRAQLIEVIGKILSRPQAERLLAIELNALGIKGVPSTAEFERIGRDVVAHVPHRSKQAALLAEVLHFLKP